MSSGVWQLGIQMLINQNWAKLSHQYLSLLNYSYPPPHKKNNKKQTKQNISGRMLHLMLKFVASLSIGCMWNVKSGIVNQRYRSKAS